MKLKSEHPLAQSKWHGVGLNLRKKLSPARINELSSSLIERHKDLSGRYNYQADAHKKAGKDFMHPLNLFSSPSEREDNMKSLETRIERLNHFNKGLHHKPIKGDHDEWEASKK